MRVSRTGTYGVKGRVGYLAASALGTLLLLLTLLAPTGAQAAAWTPEFPIPQSTGLDLSFPYMQEAQIDDQGNTTYVWAQVNLVDFTASVWSRSFPADGSIQPARRLSRANSFALAVQSGIDANGRVYVAWVESDIDPEDECGCDSDSRVEMVVLDRLGIPLNAPKTVVENGPELPIQELGFAVNSRGDSAVAFTQSDLENETNEIGLFRVSATLDASAQPFTPAGSSDFDTYLVTTINEASDVLLAWSREDIGVENNAIEARTFPAGASPSPVREVISAASPGQYREVGAVLLDAAGIGTVLYAQYVSPSNELMAQRIDRDGAFLGTSQIVAEMPGIESLRKDAAAIDASGAITVAYNARISGPGTSPLLVTRIDPSGAIRASHTVSTSPEDVGQPAISLKGDGSGSVVYINFREAGPDQYFHQIMHRSLDSEGVPSDDEVAISSTSPVTEGEAIYGMPAVAASSNGDIAAAWFRLSPVGIPAGTLLGAIYDATPPSVTLRIPATAVTGQGLIAVAESAEQGLSYRWEFGDGGVGNERVAAHAFAKPGTYTVRVTATDRAGNSAEATASVRVVGASVAARPDTRFTQIPDLRTRARRAVIRFTSTQPDSRFQCRIGRGKITRRGKNTTRQKRGKQRQLAVPGKWRSCSSPLRMRQLKPALYVVKVRAINSAGLADSSAAILRFRVLAPKRR